MWVERQQETVPPLLQHLSPFDPDSDGVGAGQRRRRRRLLVLCPRFARAARAMAAAKKMSGQSTRRRRRRGRGRPPPSAGRFDPATLTPSAHRLSVRNNATIAYADCRRGRRRRWRSCCEPLPSHRPLIRCKQRTKAARRFASVDRLFSRGAI